MITRTRLSPYLGLELKGVDLSNPLDEATQTEIIDAWIEAGVLLFRGAAHTAEEHMRLSQVFGELEPAATHTLNDPDNPYLMVLAHRPNKSGYQQNYNIGGVDRAGWLGWHWDQSFMPTIVRGACLRMTQPARDMGETGFIDAIAAYDRLSEAMKRRIEELEVVYEFNPDFASGQFGFPKDIRPLPGDSQVARGEKVFDFPPSVHPLVITQQETGRKVLKLSPMHARYVLGMDRRESDELLEELAQHLTDPKYAYFHKWAKDDVVVWDNWRVIHSATGVHPDDTRIAQRTTIVGDYKVGRYLDPSLDRDRPAKRIVD